MEEGSCSVAKVQFDQLCGAVHCKRGQGARQAKKGRQVLPMQAVTWQGGGVSTAQLMKTLIARSYIP